MWLRADVPTDPLTEALKVAIDRPFASPSVQSTGAIYSVAAPDREVARPDDWNTLRVTARGSRIDVVINGQAIQNVELDRWTEAGRNPDGSANRLKAALKDLKRDGHIGLQANSGNVSFRSIRVRRLDG